MATKKLKAELEVDTTKARQKVARDFAETGGAAAAGGGVSPEAERAGKALRNLGNEAERAGVNMKGAVRAFAGMGLGLAASYAASQMEPGSAGRKAVGFLGSVAAGAMTGSVAGPVGTAVGAGIGVVKGALDIAEEDKKAKEAKDEALRSVETWERARNSTLAFKKLLEDLTNVETDAAERLERLNAELRTRKEFEANVAQTQRYAIEKGNSAMLAEATEKRQRNAAEMESLDAVLKQMAARKGGGGASWGGVDALASVGGMFAGVGAGARPVEEIASSTAEMAKTLREIARNTENGGGTAWQ